MTGNVALLDAPMLDHEAAASLARRALHVTFIVVAVAMTIYILGHLGALAVYGLPAPFVRRIPARAQAA